MSKVKKLPVALPQAPKGSNAANEWSLSGNLEYDIKFKTTGDQIAYTVDLDETPETLFIAMSRTISYMEKLLTAGEIRVKNIKYLDAVKRNKKATAKDLERLKDYDGLKALSVFDKKNKTFLQNARYIQSKLSGDLTIELYNKSRAMAENVKKEKKGIKK